MRGISNTIIVLTILYLLIMQYVYTTCYRAMQTYVQQNFSVSPDVLPTRVAWIVL